MPGNLALKASAAAVVQAPDLLPGPAAEKGLDRTQVIHFALSFAHLAGRGKAKQATFTHM